MLAALRACEQLFATLRAVEGALAPSDETVKHHAKLNGNGNGNSSDKNNNNNGGDSNGSDSNGTRGGGGGGGGVVVTPSLAASSPASLSSPIFWESAYADILHAREEAALFLHHDAITGYVDMVFCGFFTSF
jgi:hypothetical protein